MAKKRGDNERAVDGLGILMGAFDWKEAMKYAVFKFEDVAEVVAAVEGEPDGDDWELIVKLKDGKFAWLRAGCDYSGWGCQDSGSKSTARAGAKDLSTPRCMSFQGENMTTDKNEETCPRCGNGLNGTRNYTKYGFPVTLPTGEVVHKSCMTLQERRGDRTSLGSLLKKFS